MSFVDEVSGERDALLAFLAAQRGAVRRAVHGLTAEQADQAPSASSLTLGGLVRHVALVERNWIGLISGNQPHSGSAGFEPVEGQTVEEMVADLEAVVAETEAVVAEADLGASVDIGNGSPILPFGTTRSVRWILLHLIEEVARHAGHADIIRESLDGADAVTLLAASGDWPELPELLKQWDN